NVVAEKTGVEKDLELLVFGGEDDEIVDSTFDLMQKTAPSRPRESPSSDSEDEADEGSDSDIDQGSNDESESEEADSDNESVGVGDAEDSLFFIDTGKDDLEGMDGGEDMSEDSESDEDTSSSDSENDGAAWVDDGMQQATVALKAQSRTRKLRETEDDNVVSGDVYEQRLRQQFQKVNPVPKWAAEAEGEPKTWGDEGSDVDDDRIGGDMLKSTKSLISQST
ncbi:U3 snoRNP protein, partial [Coemansia sp. RSA 2599]